MKRIHYILGVLAALCLLGTGYYAWTLYDAYRKQVAEWNEGAKAAFEEVLWLEVNKRSEIPMYHYSSGEEGVLTLNAPIPDSVFVTSAYGRRGYQIKSVRYENSLIKETSKRACLSTLLEKYPLSIDSLAIHWNRLLSKQQIPVGNQLRYIYTDLALQNDTLFSVENECSSRLDSLTVKYLGFRCEHEVVAYISYPYWITGFTRSDWCILLFPWILWVFLFVFYPKLELLVRRKLTFEKVIEKEVIVEKEVHIADVQIDKAEIFKLPDGTLFDSFTKTLSRGGILHNIQPQSASLLKLFLSMNSYKVTSEEIGWELWKDKREKVKLYSAIRRLRNDLKAVKSDLIISCTDGVYELQSPISSHISD